MTTQTNNELQKTRIELVKETIRNQSAGFEMLFDLIERDRLFSQEFVTVNDIPLYLGVTVTVNQKSFICFSINPQTMYCLEKLLSDCLKRWSSEIGNYRLAYHNEPKHEQFRFVYDTDNYKITLCINCCDIQKENIKQSLEGKEIFLDTTSNKLNDNVLALAKSLA